jgi:ppGpp synthetase/RelA/SpoT-type nucleotidyltranferase
MTISEPTIAEAVARYQREYDRYLKLCSRVADICRYEVVEANAIRAHVTFRAKGHKSLELKLRRFAQTSKKSMPTADSVFAEVRDLAAVRVATYVQTDERTVTDAIAKRFAGGNGVAVAIDLKDKHATDPNNFYRSTHLEVYLPAQDLVGTYTNVAGVPCEVQVCSMMAHVWNEIEHDIGYKPTGEFSDLEKSTLVNIGHLTRSGDGMISQLLAATDARNAEQTAAFSDVYDFVARARRWFPSVDFATNAGPLFEELQLLRLNTPGGIQKQIGDLASVADRSLTELRALSASLQQRGQTRHVLEDNSADRLLVLLLPKVAQHIVSNHPSGRGVGGPTRISWFAARYLDRPRPPPLSPQMVQRE